MAIRKFLETKLVGFIGSVPQDGYNFKLILHWKRGEFQAHLALDKSRG